MIKINVQNAKLAITAGLPKQFPGAAVPQIAFSGRSNAIRENRDIASTSHTFERMERRQKIAETDVGRALQEQIDDLLALLAAFRSGAIVEQHKG